MRKIYLTISSLIAIALLSACGGGDAAFSDGTVRVDENGNYVATDGSSSSTSTSSSSSTTNVSSSSSGTSAITLSISACPTYTPILVGDTVIRDSSSASINLVTVSDGTKKVCVVSGTAHILR